MDSIDVDGPLGHVTWDRSGSGDGIAKLIGHVGDTVTFSVTLAADSDPVDTWLWAFPPNMTLLTAQGPSVDVRLDAETGVGEVTLATSNAGGTSNWQCAALVDP